MDKKGTAPDKKDLAQKKEIYDLREELAQSRRRLNKCESERGHLIEDGLSLSFQKAALQGKVTELTGRGDDPHDPIITSPEPGK